MCGIAGIWNFSSGAPVDAEALGRMVGTLHHRGPDDRGTYISSDIGLGHTRLSIVDLEGGHQPLSNEDGTIWVVFNGEIYNHIELRQDLVKQGHVFRTHSDTEVIVHLYEQIGEDCVNAFNGQFSFALWDGTKRRLFLARDRMGVRPLFYSLQKGRLYFGSEMKALFANPELPREIDPNAIDQIFTFWFPIPPRSGFLGVEELPPGHTLVVTENGARVHRYWSLEFPEWQGTPKATTHSVQQNAEQLMELLDDAVKIRLRADVQVGAYLSGGLDSSVITALMMRQINSRLETFSIGFEDRGYDETFYQQQVVERLGTTHHPFLCSDADIGNNFITAIRHIERPIVRTAPIPMMLLSQGVHQSGIKVVLTGEGADEILAGYDIFKENKIRRFWAQNPNSRWRFLLLKRLYPYLPGLQKQSSAYLTAFFGKNLADTNDPFYSHRPRWGVTASVKSFFSREMRERLRDYDPVEELRNLVPAEFTGWHPLSQAQYLEAAFLLPGYILSSQGDRMGMANAVEGRFPFLDHRVIQFAASLPPEVKLNRLREKHVLRLGASNLLPNAVIERYKQPYRAPDHLPFISKGKFVEFAQDALTKESIENAGIFAPQSVQSLMSKALGQSSMSGRDGMSLVGILSTQVVHQLFRGSGAYELSLHRD
ncbi:MAG: asparagine synthase (glutamine-hydrolyzing) [Terriglobia bacterium]